MKPRISEIKACRPWLAAELTRIKPAVIVCLGTSAVQALLGPNITIASARNTIYESAFGPIVVTRHASSVLRMKEHDQRRKALGELVADLQRAAALTKKR